jgi:hypothetical protein
VTFPNAQSERKRQTLFQFFAEQFTDIFDGRVFKEIVPRSMVIVAENFPECLFEIGEIDDHALFGLTFNDEFNLICVSVERAAFWMVRKEVGTVHILGHAKLHVLRIACDGRSSGPQMKPHSPVLNDNAGKSLGGKVGQITDNVALMGSAEFSSKKAHDVRGAKAQGAVAE